MAAISRLFKGREGIRGAVAASQGDDVSALYSTAPGRLLTATVATLMALAAAACTGCGAKKPARPNVLLVVISGLRADHLSSYGYRRSTTPAIDTLAASGVLYENAIATAPWAPTCQGSIMTGLYPSEHLVIFEHPVLDARLDTAAEKLKAAGYSTFGASTDILIGADSGFAQGFDTFTQVRADEEGLPDEGSATAEKNLLDWIRARVTSKAPQPFFAYILMTNPQLPFNPQGEYRQKFIEKPIPLPRLDQLSQYWIPFARQYSLGLVTLAPEEMGALIALYDGEVAYADYRLGRIVDAMKELELLDDTLLIVTSDAGEDLSDHGAMADASSLYDSMIRVPLVMRLPRKIPAGRRVRDQVQTLDIMKAVLDLTAEGGAPAVGGPTAPMVPRPVAFAEARVDWGALRYYQQIAPGMDLSPLERNLLAARTLDYKYIFNSKKSAALYDLRSDPAETASALNAHVEQARDLSARLDEWGASLNSPILPPGGQGAPDARAGPAGSPQPVGEGKAR
jgi:arylsulfatase A-like enzyme